MAADRAYFKTVIFPMVLTIVSATVGIAELHCACVAKSGDAVLLVGSSGAGKSTLSLALAQEGFGFISDDRTFCSLENRDVYVWGLPTRVKLRGEALRWFRELEVNALDVRNGGAEIWLELENLNWVSRIQRARVASAVFLERTDSEEFCLRPLSSTDALNRLTADLMPELPNAVAKRAGTVRSIVERPCWLLRYGGSPQWVARQFVARFAGMSGATTCRQLALSRAEVL